MTQTAVTQTVEHSEVGERPERLALGAGDDHSPEHDGGHTHPGPGKYVVVAVVLAVFTGIEIWLSYADMNERLRTASLLFFMVLKFVLVVMYFMHLRFDNPIFRRFFIVGILLAMFVYTILLRAEHADLGDSVRSETDTEEPAPANENEGGATATSSGQNPTSAADSGVAPESSEGGSVVPIDTGAVDSGVPSPPATGVSAETPATSAGG